MTHSVRCINAPELLVLQILSMPALSPTMSQGNVASWQVTEGTEITAGDILADIETDKATLPWENQDDGFIAKLLKPSGSKDIPVGTPLVVLVEEKDHIGDFKDFSPEGQPVEAGTSQQDHQTGDCPSMCLLTFDPQNCGAGVMQFCHQCHANLYHAVSLTACMTSTSAAHDKGIIHCWLVH